MDQISQTGNLVSILAIVLMAVLAVAAYTSGKGRLSNKIFVFFNLSAIIWVTTNLIANLSVANPSLNYLFWTKTTLIGPIFMVLLLIIFADVFPGEKLRLNKMVITVLSVISFIVLMLIPTELFVKSVEIINPQKMISSYQPGSLMVLYAAYFICYAVMATIIFIRKLFNVNKKERKQISIVLAGLIISMICGVIMSVILPLFGYNNLINISPIASTFFIVFTAYAILKHQFLNVRVIATETLVIFIVIVLLIETLLSKSTTELITRAAFLLLVTYFGYRLIKSVIDEIERRKEMEKLASELRIINANITALQRINNKIVSTLDIQKVSQEIVDSITEDLGYAGSLIVLIDKERRIARPYAISKNLAKIARPFLKKKLFRYSSSISNDDNLIVKAIKSLDFVMTDNLYLLLKDAFPKTVAHALNAILPIKSYICVPVVSHGEVIGVIVFGSVKRTDKINQQDKNEMSGVADQAAIAIENAELYQKVEKANAKLKELDQLKNEFLSIASHQVRTPLSIIKGYISLLRDGKAGKLNEQEDHFMKNIQEANDQLINIINDFLNLSRIEQKRMKIEVSKADMEAAIDGVIERLGHEAELKKIELRYIKKDSLLPKICADEPKIIEVVTNLIDNAIKYSPEGRKVIVTSEKINSELKISVQDFGIGIPKDFKEQLFQKFARAHNAIQAQPNGNGIGLFLVKKIIEAHGGRINVKSKEKKGTTFEIFLNYKSGLKSGEEIDSLNLTKNGIIRYDEFGRDGHKN